MTLPARPLPAWFPGLMRRSVIPGVPRPAGAPKPAPAWFVAEKDAYVRWRDWKLARPKIPRPAGVWTSVPSGENSRWRSIGEPTFSPWRLLAEEQAKQPKPHPVPPTPRPSPPAGVMAGAGVMCADMPPGQADRNQLLRRVLGLDFVQFQTPVTRPEDVAFVRANSPRTTVAFWDAAWTWTIWTEAQLLARLVDLGAQAWEGEVEISRWPPTGDHYEPVVPHVLAMGPRLDQAGIAKGMTGPNATLVQDANGKFPAGWGWRQYSYATVEPRWTPRNEVADMQSRVRAPDTNWRGLLLGGFYDERADVPQPVKDAKRQAALANARAEVPGLLASGLVASVSVFRNETMNDAELAFMRSLLA